MEGTQRQSVKIAILDSGLKTCHPAISGKQFELVRIWENGTISNEEKDGEDIFGHGTAIYNIYRSRLPEAYITCYKIQDGFEEADENCLIAALEKILEEQDYDLINISLGTTCFSSRLYDLCEQISRKGSVLVAAFDNDGAISYPAAYPFVIGVDSSDNCNNRNQIEYVHSNLVNIRANGKYQRLAWVNPDYILLGGSSFACAHVGVIIADFIQKGVAGYENMLSALRKAAVREIGFVNRSGSKRKTLFPIQKAAIVPFNKEIHSIVRYSDLLGFEIEGIYDYKYSPHIGATPDHLLHTDSLSFNRKIQNIDHIEWDNFDTLIVGHLEHYGKLTNRESAHTELINKALNHHKKVFSFDVNKEFEDNDNVYYPLIDQRNLQDNCFGKLYKLNKPIIGVFGTSSKQGKYTLQLAMRRQLLKMGWHLGQIGTEPTGELFGMDCSFPMGYNSSVNLTGGESIVYINNALADLCKKDVDLIMIGSQSNTVPYSYANLAYYPLTQINLLMAAQPDVVVLCVNPFDDDNYIERTKNTMESLAGTKVIALVVFPMKLRDNFGSIYSSKVPLTKEECEAVTERLQKRHGVKTFVLNENIAAELCETIISYLSE